MTLKTGFEDYQKQVKIAILRGQSFLICTLELQR